MDAAWLDLLNSDYHDYLGRQGGEDRLDNTKWLGRFLSRWELSAAERSSGPLGRSGRALEERRGRGRRCGQRRGAAEQQAADEGREQDERRHREHQRERRRTAPIGS